MMFRFLILYSFLLLMLYDEVNSQICRDRKLFTYTTTERRYRSEVEHYRDKCWWGTTCTKTRLKFVPTFVTVTKREWRSISVCCDGYNQEYSEDDKLVCKAICMPSCLNGFCQSPGICTCNDGYIPNPSNQFHCMPECPGHCNNGICIAPNKCECFYGYTSINGTCQPICNIDCVNGKCVAPETCECLEGYRTENDICKPYCEYCENGSHCTAPGVCTCDEGFEHFFNNCIPICTSGCNGGTCVAPNICECEAGYELNNGTCEPLCSGCGHGHCTLPFECICDAGYVLELGNSFELSCQPNCTVDCGNGKCVAPDVCVCDSGYMLKESCDPTCCEPHCSKKCNYGTCAEPEFCVCDTGYVMDFNTSECVPKCDYDCGQGKCIDPNTCDCEYGYGQNETAEFIDEPICKPICKNCEGTCVAPYVCVCDPNVYITVNVTEDGENCDCFENCTDISLECKKTICKEIGLVQKNDSLAEIQPMVGFPTNISTTTIENFSSTFDFTTDFFLFTTEDELPLSKNIESATEGRSSETRSTPVWIFYVVAAIIILLVVTAIAVLLIWRMGYLGRGSYVVENKCASESSQNDFDMIVR